MSKHPTLDAHTFDVKVKWEDWEHPTYMSLDTALEDVPELAQ